MLCRDSAGRCLFAVQAHQTSPARSPRSRLGKSSQPIARRWQLGHRDVEVTKVAEQVEGLLACLERAESGLR